MITGVLPSKYHTKHDNFLKQCKTIATVKQIFVNIEDKYFKIECSTQKIPEKDAVHKVSHDFD